MADSSERIVMMTLWRSMDDLYAWLGGADLLGTPLDGGDSEMFSEFDIQHYEALALDHADWALLDDPDEAL